MLVWDMGQVRAVQRHAPRKRDDEEPLTARIVELAGAYGRHGYRRVTENAPSGRSTRRISPASAGVSRAGRSVTAALIPAAEFMQRCEPSSEIPLRRNCWADPKHQMLLRTRRRARR